MPRWLKISLVLVAVVLGSCSGCMALGVASARYGATDVRAVCTFAVIGRPIVEVRRFADERSLSGSDYPPRNGKPAMQIYRKGRTGCLVEHDGAVVTFAKASFLD